MSVPSLTWSESLEAYRPLLFSIAYRMLGSATDAEDIVQDTFLRYTAALNDKPNETVRSPRALLTTIATRLCLDQLKSARARHERYAGPWLPEPVLTGTGGEPLSPLDTAEQRDSISMGVMALLERLSPAERAVFVLREAFGYSYDEVGPIIGKTAQACRQLHHRASQHVASGRPRFTAPPEAQRLIVEQFVAAANGGDVTALAGLLAADAVLFSDGGGKAAAALRPILGQERIIRFLFGIWAKAPAGTRVVWADVNGQPGLVVLVDRSVYYTAAFDVVDGQIAAIRSVLNPDKLAYVARQLAARAR